MLLKTGLLVLADAGLLWWLGAHIRRDQFRELKWPLAIGAGLFWAILSSALIWGYWDNYYAALYPGWTRWSAPILFVEYGLLGLLLWWVASRLPGNPAVNLCLLGGVESIAEHLYGFYVLGIMKTPILQGQSEAEIMAFAVFEYVLYWAVIVGAAWLLGQFRERRRSPQNLNLTPPGQTA